MSDKDTMPGCPFCGKQPRVWDVTPIGIRLFKCCITMGPYCIDEIAWSYRPIEDNLRTQLKAGRRQKDG